MLFSEPQSVPEPRSFPVGESLPPMDIHAVSVSIPTWDMIVRYMKGDKELHGKLKADYPRHVVPLFYQHAIVSKLNNAVLARIGAPRPMQYTGLPIQEVEFRIAQKLCKETATWGHFFAVIFPEQSKQQAEEFWGFMGDGISSRHAEFCLARFPFMSSTSADPSLETRQTCDDIERLPAVPWRNSSSDTKDKIKDRIAEWVSSQKPGQEPVRSQDVILYPKGMCAIGTVARLLVPASSTTSEAVVFGWPYGSTPKCVKRSGYERFTFHDQGTSDELDQLEESLACGRLISCLFCEVPSNPLCATPDLHRIRRLADQYHFVVVCDETIGTFVNVDVLPYVDVIITSLTKIFSGGCNVMGGSVVLNARSPFYGQIHGRLSAMYVDLLYPLDAEVILSNCTDFPARVQKANRNGMTIAMFLQTQGSISRVNYPAMGDTTPLYERYRRPDGGYGSLISIVFRNPDSAVVFYNRINLCKGPSFGANFTLVLPYSQLAHAYELEWAESKGIPRHIVRISVGIEEESDLVSRFHQALKEVENFEKSLAHEM
ncbi:hypothetical protein G4B11_007291 [Aspergillus flavus]|nr:hypothetical protein G4B11_007291 [Aspergillus flavus]